MKIIKMHKELFYRCQGNCRICFLEGTCILEKKIKKYGLERIKKEVYNE